MPHAEGVAEPRRRFGMDAPDDGLAQRIAELVQRAAVAASKAECLACLRQARNLVRQAAAPAES
jgi:bacterioferritin-associated ferredoxin